jgi:hypothetical protein
MNNRAWRRQRERKGGKRTVPLGIVASSAPAAALLAALRELRPQFDVRLLRISDASGIETLYRVEVDVLEAIEPRREIDMWLRIKSALMAAFPSDKPGAVTAIDP